MLPPNLSPRILLPRILILAGLLFCGSALRAATIYSNFNFGDGYSTGTGLIVTDNSFDYSVSVAFTPNSDYILSGIDFVATRGTEDAPDSVTIGIFADSGGHPGAVPIEAFTLTGQTELFGATAPVLSVTSMLHPTLQANMLYWVEMSGPLGSLIWNQNTTLASNIAETDGQGNWMTSNVTQGVLRITGDVTNVAPEPAAWLLMSGGIAAIISAGRHRTRRS